MSFAIEFKDLFYMLEKGVSMQTDSCCGGHAGPEETLRQVLPKLNEVIKQVATEDMWH